MNKKIFGLALFTAMVLSAGAVFPLDYIFDDYLETNTYDIHSYGLATYGVHSNTFQLRDMYLRGNYNLSDDINELQIFATVYGYKDTHDPQTNYGYDLGNLNLYDYGSEYRLFKMFFISLRGASVYQFNTETFMLLPAYINSYNSTETYDSPQQYIADNVNYVIPPAGIRFGYMDDHYELGYSQGDFRHDIPKAALAKVTFDDFYVRVLFQHSEIVTNWFDTGLSNEATCTQVSFGGKYQMGDLTFHGILEGVYWGGGTTNTADQTYDPLTGNIWVRLEEAVTWHDFTLGFRELMMNYAPTLYEISLKKEFFHVDSFGILIGSDGIYTRFYIGDEIYF
jgi:hypothetical protein